MTHVAEMLGSYPKSLAWLDQAKLAECIEACFDCAQVCTACADACLAEEMVADLVVGFRALKERFTSRVTKERPSHIHVDYLEGPLKYLKNDWTFEPDGEGGCLVDFCVDFEFRSRIFEALAGQMFGMALKKMIGAFETRAQKLYGSAVSPGSNNSSAHSAA